MGPPAKSPYDEEVEAAEPLHGLSGYGAAVSEVGDSPHAKAEYHGPAVMDFQGRYLRIEGSKGLFHHRCREVRPPALCRLLPEYVFEHHADPLDGLRVPIAWYGGVLYHVEAPEVVYAVDVVRVRVGEEDGVDARYAVGEGLSPQVGGCVYEDVLAPGLNERRGPRAPVPWLRGCAYSTAAAYYRHAR